MTNLERRADEVDVLMLVEGTYPFVRGGVASWISELIISLPQYRFGIVFLGANKSMYEEFVYPVPDNVTHLQIACLFDNKEPVIRCPHVDKNASKKIAALHDLFRQSHYCPVGLTEALPDLDALMNKKYGMNFAQFMRSKESWELIQMHYNKDSGEPSFINYFWNVRNMHEPLWVLSEAILNIPKCRVIHPIATGYAGFLSVLIKQQQKRSIILSEHGLYTKERNFELLQLNVFAGEHRLSSDKKLLNYRHQLWLRFYETLGRMCYQEASVIISLYEGARKQQCEFGASLEKTRVIPNGIQIASFSSLRRSSEDDIPKVVSFVGRFVRIKDVKTFILSIYHAHQAMPEIKSIITIVGKPDEDYLDECRNFIRFLSIESIIEFVYEGGMHAVLSKTGVLVLSSISEGMPLVALEAMAAGVPLVATDVGACSELIYGMNEEDKAIGASGVVVSVADPLLLSEALIFLLSSKKHWLSAHHAAIKRADRYYERSLMVERYDTLYKENMAPWQA